MSGETAAVDFSIVTITGVSGLTQGMGQLRLEKELEYWYGATDGGTNIGGRIMAGIRRGTVIDGGDTDIGRTRIDRIGRGTVLGGSTHPGGARIGRIGRGAYPGGARIGRIGRGTYPGGARIGGIG